MTNEKDVLGKTQHWLSEVIVGHQLCPFAEYPWRKQQIQFIVAQDVTRVAICGHVLSICRYLQAHSEVETSLLILPSAWDDFNDYLELVEVVNDLLQKEQLSGIFQIASFHPAYLFASEAPDATSHYTNRSPYPMLHIIREASITRVIDAGFDTEALIERNQQLAEQLGTEFFRQFLD